MTTYLAFLRAINLGPNRTFPKAAIKGSVERVGFSGVETHINTGNVRFDSSMRSRARIEGLLEESFLADRGFEVPTIVYSAKEFAEIARDVEELEAEHPGLERHYVLLLKVDPTDEVVEAVHALDGGTHRTVVRGRAAHLLLGAGYQAGGTDPLGAEKLLGVVTNRNHKVVTEIARKWC